MSEHQAEALPAMGPGPARGPALGLVTAPAPLGGQAAPPPVAEPDAPEVLRDPTYIRRILPLARLFSRLYFRPRVFGLDRVPGGQVLLVGNHSGGLSTPDTIVVAQVFWRHFGVDRPAYALVHPSAFEVPGMGKHIRQVGGLPATSRMAEQVLRSGASLFVYPGGGHDAYRPWDQRHRVRLGTQSGYLRLALRHGIPIVPVVCNGGHETFVCLDDGEERARALGLDKQGVERLPLSWSVPWGLALGVHYTLPLPCQIDVSFGHPIRFGGGVRGRLDKGQIAGLHLEVEAVMQRMLDELVALRQAAGAPTITV